MTFNLVLDEPVQDDQVEEHEGLLFMVANRLVETYKGFTIALIQRGNQSMLQIIPDLKVDEGGGCSSCSSCG